jgi:four helix bundle protein
MSEGEKSQKFDLIERTTKFGEDIVKFCRLIPRGPITDPMIIQLVKCGTSTGANYSEADDAESRQDFGHKIGICKKESRESGFFLRMICTANPELREKAAPLIQEAKELNLIFNSIYKKVKK